MRTSAQYRLFLVLGLALLLTSASVAAGCRPQVRDGWVRLPPAGAEAAMPMLAGFGRIVNACPMPATITGAKSSSFAGVELHETRTVDGISRMRPVPTLRIAPDGSATFRPGGMHLMLMRPSARLNPGSRIVVEFRLAGGGSLLGEFEVRKAAP
ncbi:MAG: copper chaperone PCu(A)C [Lysobacteraceae bacterium]